MVADLLVYHASFRRVDISILLESLKFTSSTFSKPAFFVSLMRLEPSRM